VTRYLLIHEVLALHERIAEQAGGGVGQLDSNPVASVAMHRATDDPKESRARP